MEQKDVDCSDCGVLGNDASGEALECLDKSGELGNLASCKLVAPPGSTSGLDDRD